MKGVMIFGNKGKLNPRYIFPYQLVQKIRNVSYELELLKNLASDHHVFDVSFLKKCEGDHSLVVLIKNIGVKYSLSYEEVPIEIMDL